MHLVYCPVDIIHSIKMSRNKGILESYNIIHPDSIKLLK